MLPIEMPFQPWIILEELVPQAKPFTYVAFVMLLVLMLTKCICHNIVKSTETKGTTMSTDENDATLDECAACERKAGDLKTCVACKEVKYCNATCQKSHRSKHKKKCRKRAAELHDEALFKQPPKEECPICFLSLPHPKHTMYMVCCGKTLCNGCIYAQVETSGNSSCPFCRAHAATEENYIERLKKRIAANDAEAFQSLACKYDKGTLGMPQDREKSRELMLRAAELGSRDAYTCLAADYVEGRIEMNMKKLNHYWERAAMGGCLTSRFNLGSRETGERNNMDRAMKHWMIGARDGHDESLNNIRQGYTNGFVSKDDFEEVLRAHKETTDEMWSDQRKAVIRHAY